VLTLLTFKIGVANFASFAFWKSPTLLTLFLEQIANSNFAIFGSGKLYYPLQASAPASFFFQFFHNPHRRSPIQFKKIRSATRSKLSAQGRGIQRSHYTTLWDSAQAIC